ncbi:NAD(P)H-quinone oxidoreductase subunit 3 [Helicobacter saguini]|uniref:NADH-quinone oxidoreductase subunit A n=1 Tax=Helicobacter saguini TaxID=1548018 RepID=A0A347VPF6_9HELI|nr:NAD(P)H-quinone oxidoreductase subunit 3 [Helicobacter saguini]MWV61384.1 NAD(P)H-quinone oxidoreductase subunit 3 [Helicobacter saguini]MWV67948.1 NAD(P)H-quinone oxidoreductase subunit 3 [Helicobacter saguini]MWV70585.1 NAD(P)H-quinone oxidoreductase subunit 3 [Helicobacter saguini]MWV72489.1 NAD(P)H-quinone oxidoreductase subunit 3 [Helicobacter saguini]TLD94764.1 NAD(P)H-quinone oxidoreductase subunit 3 [Helicobacter saguini]
MDYMALHPYFGAFVMFVLTLVAFVATFWLQRFVSRKLAFKKSDKLKGAPYECGPIPIKQANRISHQFYVIAVLFVLFDVEIIFMIPWAIEYRNLGLLGFFEMLTFIILLVVGFFFAWKRGALKWQEVKRNTN